MIYDLNLKSQIVPHTAALYFFLFLTVHKNGDL